MVNDACFGGGGLQSNGKYNILHMSASSFLSIHLNTSPLVPYYF